MLEGVPASAIFGDVVEEKPEDADGLEGRNRRGWTTEIRDRVVRLPMSCGRSVEVERSRRSVTVCTL